jgi:plastocyanin
MRSKVTVGTGAAAVLVALYLLACSSSPSTPTPTPDGGGGGGGGADVTISIVGMNGAQSFSPNPASVQSGQTVRWVNNDSVTHRVVQDGGGVDTGNLAPGASSAAVTVTSAATISYHCSIHPTMIGTINGTAPAGGAGGY